MEKQQQCSKCGYRQEIPGDTHISCLFDWGKIGRLKGLRWPAGNPHGIAKGWYNFPFNYDPMWMTEECHGFSEKADPEMKVPGDPFFKLIALLGRK
jgi:hypothetical protein